MLTPSRTGLFPSPTQKVARMDYSKPSILRRRSSHGPSPLGRTVSTPPSPVGSRPRQQPPRRKPSGTKGDKESTSSTSTSFATDASSNGDASRAEDLCQDVKTFAQAITKGEAESSAIGAVATSTDNSEEEDTYEDELDKLIVEFREWKNDMKDTIDDFKRQLNDLQGDFSRTLRAIPTDVIAS